MPEKSGFFDWNYNFFHLSAQCASEKLPKSSKNTEWNSGGKYHLSELSTVLDSNLLQELKSECGGLQTLLRNHNHIFIVDKGFVR